MTRNFGLGSRSLRKAGELALRDAVSRGYIGYSSANTIGYRWGLFIEYVKENEDEMKKMEDIDAKVVIKYGQELAHLVQDGEIAVATAHNYVSAINSVMDLATWGRWGSVSPIHDCEIPERSQVRKTAPVSSDRCAYARCLEVVREDHGARAASIVELCRELGFRSKESSVANASRMLTEALSNGIVTVKYGTKGGRARRVSISRDSQIEVLQRAALAQAGQQSLIPVEQSWSEWRDGDLRKIRETVQQSLGDGFRDLRAAYACERYEVITGVTPPVTGGPKAPRAVDQHARQIIAMELGHRRREICNAYVGGTR